MNPDARAFPNGMTFPPFLASMPDINLATSQAMKPASSVPELGNLMLTPDQMAALSLSILQLQPPPMFYPMPALGMPGLPYGMPALPPHSTIESLGLITPNMGQLRPTVSAMSSPVQSQKDIRPRAFSSAATLQHPKSGDRRRKRSRHEEERQSHNNSLSVLRNLVEAEDEPIRLKMPATDTYDDEKIKQDVAKVLVLDSTPCEPPTKRSPPPSDHSNQLPLRRIIRDQDLPETVGPDSPFRHHPKYQKKRSDAHGEMVEKMEAITAFCVVNGMWKGDSPAATEIGQAPIGKTPMTEAATFTTPPTSNQSLVEMLDQAIVRELVTAE